MQEIARQLYVDPDRRSEFVRLMNEHDSVWGFESPIYRKDGTVIWISENVRVIQDEDGKVLYYEGTVEDITAREAGGRGTAPRQGSSRGSEPLEEPVPGEHEP